jgi:putative endonuclease
VAEHREGRGSAFTRDYNVKRLVYAEHFVNPAEAIAHEKRMKRWHCAWKIELIERSNPHWNDLYRMSHLD